MKRTVDAIYPFALYCGFSVFLMSIQFLMAGGLVYAVFMAALFTLGPGRLSAAACDSAGFAFLTVSNTLIQYYMASLLARDLRKKTRSFCVLVLACGVSALFFHKLAAGSSLSSYALSTLPLIISYLLGGIAGLMQKDAENPFRGRTVKIFRLD